MGYDNKTSEEDTTEFLGLWTNDKLYTLFPHEVQHFLLSSLMKRDSFYSVEQLTKNSQVL